MPRPSTTVRVDLESYEVLESYRRWLQRRRRRKKLAMSEAVRELLVRKARDVMSGRRL